MALEARLASQNALFRNQFEDDLKSSPETATSYGDYRYNALLDHYSMAAITEQDGLDQRYRTELAAIPTVGFPEQDSISHDLLLHVLTQRIADYALKEYEMPVSQMEGIHTDLADLPLSVPLDTLQHYEDYLARLRQVPRAFDEVTSVLRQGMKDGLMPARFLLEQVPAQCEGIIEENPFLGPTRKYPTNIPPKDQARLTQAIMRVVSDEVLPAYRRFAIFIKKEYAPLGRMEIGVSSLPDGLHRYRNAIQEQTSTSMSPAEIHALGLREVARITGLLDALAKQQGYRNLAEFGTALLSNPKYIPTSADQIVQDFRRYMLQMETRLPQLFVTSPQISATVEAIPASQPNNASHFIAGTPDGKHPSRVVVATSDYGQRRLLTDETIAYHEGIPGHLMQISVQQQLKDLPDFRRHLINNAFAEGWAVYAEALGKQIGFFQDPGSDYGRLTTELLRAVRLVIDTGIHVDGWSRDQAVDYFRRSGAAPEPLIQSEVDRYIAWPAQSLGYKIGQLKILELRDRAKASLGDHFDLRRFHDEVLSGGNMPLDMLDARLGSWVKQQPQGPAAK